MRTSSRSIAIELELDAGIDLDTGLLLADGELVSALSWSEWQMEACSEIDDSVWDLQSLSVIAERDPWELESTLRVDTDTLRFRDWKTEIVYDRGIWEAELELKLTRTQSWLVFDAEREGDTVELNTRLRLRSSSSCKAWDFYDARLRIDGSLCESLEASAEIEFDCSGFAQQSLTLEELTVPGLPWLQIELEFERSPERTTIGIDPTVELGEELCLETEMEIKAQGDLLTSLRILECSMACDLGAWELDAIVLWDPDDWIDDRFCTRLSLEGEWESMECRALELSIDLYGRGELTHAVHLAQVTLEAEAELTDHVSGTMGLVLDLDDPAANRLLLGIDLDLSP